MSTTNGSARRSTSSKRKAQRTLTECFNKAAQKKQSAPNEFDSVVNVDTKLDPYDSEAMGRLLDESHWVFQEGVEVLPVSIYEQKTRSLPDYQRSYSFTGTNPSLVCWRRTAFLITKANYGCVWWEDRAHNTWNATDGFGSYTMRCFLGWKQSTIVWL